MTSIGRYPVHRMTSGHRMVSDATLCWCLLLPALGDAWFPIDGTESGAGGGGYPRATVMGRLVTYTPQESSHTYFVRACKNHHVLFPSNSQFVLYGFNMLSRVFFFVV